MRKGNDILDKFIGQKLSDGIFQSYLYNGILSDKINVAFLKFDKWIQITTTDESAIIEIDKPEQIISWTNDNDSTAEFPLAKIENEFLEFKNILGQTFLKYNELVIHAKDYCDITLGLKLYFDNELTLILYSDFDDNSYFLFDNKIPINLTEKK